MKRLMLLLLVAVVALGSNSVFAQSECAIVFDANFLKPATIALDVVERTCSYKVIWGDANVVPQTIIPLGDKQYGTVEEAVKDISKRAGFQANVDTTARTITIIRQGVRYPAAPSTTPPSAARAQTSAQPQVRFSYSAAVLPDNYQGGPTWLDYKMEQAQAQAAVNAAALSYRHSLQMQSIYLEPPYGYTNPYYGGGTVGLYGPGAFRNFQLQNLEGGLKTKGSTRGVVIYARGCYVGDAQEVDGMFDQKLPVPADDSLVLTAVRLKDWKAYDFPMRPPSEAENRAVGANHLTLRIHDEFFAKGYDFNPSDANAQCSQAKR